MTVKDTLHPVGWELKRQSNVVVAFDPGVTTGIAYKDGSGIHTEQIRTTHRAIWNWTDWVYVDEIVYERFNYQRRDKVVLYPVEVIGVIKLISELHNIPIREQTPSQAMNLWTDDKIRRLGLWTPNQVHGMDALRHLLYYLTVWKKDRTWIDALKPTET